MDCRTCEPILIDLVHDELATDAAEEARAHLSGCASCRASFERLVEARRLGSMLELAEPPQRVRAHLLQLAEARAGELRAAAAPKVKSSTFSRAVLDFVARFATGPQVGMATIMLLIVAFGLWALPRMRPDAVAGGTVINPESQGEAAPSKTGVEPAERLDLKVDARSGRIRNRDGQPEPPPSAPSAPAPASPAVEVAEAEPTGTEPGAKDDPLADLDDFDGIVGGQARAGAKRKAAESKRASVEAEALSPLDPGPERFAAADKAAAEEPQRSAEPQPFPESSTRTSTGAGALAGLGKGAAAESSAGPARQEGAESAPAPPPRSVAASPYRSATPASAAPPVAQTASGRRARKPSPAALDDLLDSAVAARSAPPRHSTSLLVEARSVARADGCLAALPSYERVVSSAPTSTDAGSALIEMAQCRRSAGQLAEARRLLERAQEIPATAARARALLAELAARPAAR